MKTWESSSSSMAPLPAPGSHCPEGSLEEAKALEKARALEKAKKGASLPWRMVSLFQDWVLVDIHSWGVLILFPEDSTTAKVSLELPRSTPAAFWFHFSKCRLFPKDSPQVTLCEVWRYPLVEGSCCTSHRAAAMPLAFSAALRLFLRMAAAFSGSEPCSLALALALALPFKGLVLFLKSMSFFKDFRFFFLSFPKGQLGFLQDAKLGAWCLAHGSYMLYKLATLYAL